MQKTFVKSRVLTPVLVLAAVVALALVLLFTLRGKADEPAGEIADFSYQTLSALDLANDADTDLRFLFTVGSLSYDEVGFVFSKTNSHWRWASLIKMINMLSFFMKGYCVY